LEDSFTAVMGDGTSSSLQMSEAIQKLTAFFDAEFPAIGEVGIFLYTLPLYTFWFSRLIISSLSLSFSPPTARLAFFLCHLFPVASRNVGSSCKLPFVKKNLGQGKKSDKLGMMQKP
jgi:hypothetical protein